MRAAKVLLVGGGEALRQRVANILGLPAESVKSIGVLGVQRAIGVDSPDVLVIAPDVPEGAAFSVARSMSETSPVTAVVLLREFSLNGTLPQAMRSGIRDVIDMSDGSDELTEALRRAVEWSESLRSLAGDDAEAEAGTMISVFSSKGGTGKTFLTCNLAAALAELSGTEVAVCDLDFDLGDVFSYFGRDATRSIGDLTSLTESSDREAVLGVGVDLADHLWGFGAPNDPTAPAVSGPTTAGILKALRRHFSYVVIDASADYSEQALAAFDLSDAVCLVAGLDIVGVKHLAKAMETLMSIDIPRDRLRVVLNRADSKVGLEVADVQRVLKLTVDARIPSSRLVPASLNSGRPVYLQDPRSEVSKSVADLARTFISESRPGAASADGERRRRLFARGG